MYYENPKVPNEVNVSRVSDTSIGSYLEMIAVIVVTFIAFFVIIYFFVRFFAAFLPYSVETSIANGFSDFASKNVENSRTEVLGELQNLALNLAKSMNAPQDMPLHINIIKGNEKNAFATIGGYIFVTEGLLNVVESENALAMVLAHEIAHIKNRDVITAIASSATFSLIMAITLGSDDWLLKDGVSMATLSFSRTQEERADKDALLALKNYYGHTFGAEEFFQKVLKNDTFSINFLNSHPNTQKRIGYILQTQNIDEKAELKPLSQAILAIKKR